MLKVDVIILEKRNTLISFYEFGKVLEVQLKGKVSKVFYEKDTLKIFLKESILLVDIENLLFKRVKVKELRWKLEKGLNGGTSFLEVIIP